MCTWQVSRKFALCVGDVLHVFAFNTRLNTRLDGNAAKYLLHIYDRKQNFRTSQEQFANVPVLFFVRFCGQVVTEKTTNNVIYVFKNRVRKADCEWC